MRDDQRQRIFMLGTDVDEVDVKPVDSSVEVRHGVEPLLDLPPVVIGLPVVQNLLDGLERHTLRIVTDSLLLRQTGVGQAAAQIGERGLWNVNAERTDGIARWLSFGRWPAAIMPDVFECLARHKGSPQVDGLLSRLHAGQQLRLRDRKSLVMHC